MNIKSLTVPFSSWVYVTNNSETSFKHSNLFWSNTPSEQATSGKALSSETTDQ